LQFSVPGFEYPRPDVGVPLHFIGSISQQPSKSDVPAWWPELESGVPVLHVTQGTIANNDFTELVRPTLEALSGEDVLVVVSTGGKPVSELGPLPTNARAAEFLPYDRLLPLTSVMVTNGGYGGVHYALGAGVPLVTAGVTEDKAEVGARISWSGVGVRLRTGRPSADAIRGAAADAWPSVGTGHRLQLR
jgi:UDP:flavonoid glycosyltransferase YjiC (YdhE family)